MVKPVSDPPCRCSPVHHPQWTLYGAFSYAYGKSTYMVWKAVGAGLLTVLPAITYTLKAGAAAQHGTPHDCASRRGAKGCSASCCRVLPRASSSPAVCSGPMPASPTLLPHVPLQHIPACGVPSAAFCKGEQASPPAYSQDKAENDLLARPMSRTLSLGLMAASIGHLLVLCPILNQASLWRCLVCGGSGGVMVATIEPVVSRRRLLAAEHDWHL